MTKLLFKHRNGADLYKYMKLALSSTDRANEWALQLFCYNNDDGKNLDIQQIANIKNKKPELYVQLTNSVFPFDISNSGELEMSDSEIIYDDGEAQINIEIKPITSDLIQEMQAEKGNFKKGGEVDLMFRLASKMFEVSVDSLKEYPAILTMHLCNEVNTFLGELANTRDNFDIEDDILFPTGKNGSNGVGKLVSESDETIEGDEQTKTEVEDSKQDRTSPPPTPLNRRMNISSLESKSK